MISGREERNGRVDFLRCVVRPVVQVRSIRSRRRRGPAHVILCVGALGLASVTIPGWSTVAEAASSSTWTSQVAPSGVGLSAISCPSTTDCEAAGSYTNGVSQVIATRDGGTTWAVQPVPSSIGSIESISCASTASCIAVGSTGTQGTAIATGNGGATWSTETLSTNLQELSSISCASTLSCVATGFTNTYPAGSSVPLNAAISTTDGGVTW
jgi:photosystem II stability/assembly factor-like uncharacterized protein